MGICVYCNEKAGLLRTRHKECEAQFQRGRKAIVASVLSAVNGNVTLEALKADLNKIQIGHYISDVHLRRFLVEGWEQAVENSFDDGLLDESEETGLVAISNGFNLSQRELDESGAYSRVVKGAVLRDLMEGKIPDRINLSERLPFNFQKSERPIWVFANVEYFEQKTRRQYLGGSSGVSVRIAKGVYYRTSSFKGRPVDYVERIHAGTGLLAVTNKHIYFGGGNKSFRVRLDKIVSFEPFTDGIGIQRDAASAKPQTFVTGDGWFTYNLVQNVANL